MSEGDESKSSVGVIEWCDLTVDDAIGVSDFYCDVVGWNKTAMSMGDYDDYEINLPATGATVAGICHARGSNANLPAQWLMYVRVEDVERSAARCAELGGEILDGPREMAGSNFCVIRDPAGAVLALMSNL